MHNYAIQAHDICSFEDIRPATCFWSNYYTSLFPVFLVNPVNSVLDLLGMIVGVN